MLARSFKTPVELNITDKQFDALVQVLGMLERGELPWHKGSTKPKIPSFNMASWPSFGTFLHCGTVGCIGYWTEKLIGEEFDEISTDLDDVFHPNGEASSLDWNEDISPEHAAHALRNYLTTGKADWAGVLELAY